MTWQMSHMKKSEAKTDKHVVVIAGEESGDKHAAEIIRQLKEQNLSLRFSGIGGRHMQAAGVPLISDLARYGVTGLTAVFKHIRVIRQAFKLIKTHLIQDPPDLLILVDYPGFNLRLAKFAKRLGIHVIYYISPQIWAWKAGRIHTIRKCIDTMAVIFPFEKKIYEKAGVPVVFVGHPLMKKSPINPDSSHVPRLERETQEISKTQSETDTNLLRNRLGLPTHQRIIAMLPGSRINEIDFHMPVLVETAKRLFSEHHDLHFVIPIAGTISPEKITRHLKGCPLPFTFIEGKAVEVATASDFIIVASGTASLECALLEKPMCIIYKGSKLSYFLLCYFIKIQYLGLCNILQNRMIVPELLQYDCNAHELTKLCNQLLANESASHGMKKDLRLLKDSLSAEQADCNLDALILETLETL
jgi:lipid-A-disaccharide synthase